MGHKGKGLQLWGAAGPRGDEVLERAVGEGMFSIMT